MYNTDTEAGRRKPCLRQSRLRPSVHPGGHGEGTEGEKGPIPENNYLSQ